MSKIVKGGIKGSWSDKTTKKKVKVNVSVLFFEEDDIQYAFIPSLDVIGYGKTDVEAEQSLKIVLDEFLTYTVHKKTLNKELVRLGWKVKRARKDFIAPSISDQIRSNEQLKDIVDNKTFRTSQLAVNIPAEA